jgi:L-lactate dehydrogenase (cytochrome)
MPDLNWTEQRRSARARLPRFLFDYADGGAGSEATMSRNVADLEAVTLRQRVLRDVSDVRLDTVLLGRPMSMPVVLGPVGMAGMYARRGEVQAKAAADGHGLPFCLSTVSVCPLAEVAATGAPDPWFQLYVMKDRGFMTSLMDEASARGVTTLVFTVDMPVPGIRQRDSRSGLSGRGAPARRLVQALARPGWAVDVGLRGRPHTLGNIAPALGGRAGLSDFMGWIGRNFDPSISWRDLEALRADWKGTLILKGVMDPLNARQAADIGVDALVVSNHGGRQLDGAISTARALPSIAEAVGDRVCVMADSGVRSGLDVVRMLALGARAVWLGRLWVFALATGGAAGVSRMLETLRAEMAVAMALTGCGSLEDLTPEVLDLR